MRRRLSRQASTVPSPPPIDAQGTTISARQTPDARSITALVRRPAQLQAVSTRRPRRSPCGESTAASKTAPSGLTSISK
jgi:hypothetical protein